MVRRRVQGVRRRIVRRHRAAVAQRSRRRPTAHRSAGRRCAARRPTTAGRRGGHGHRIRPPQRQPGRAARAGGRRRRLRHARTSRPAARPDASGRSAPARRSIRRGSVRWLVRPTRRTAAAGHRHRLVRQRRAVRHPRRSRLGGHCARGPHHTPSAHGGHGHRPRAHRLAGGRRSHRCARPGRPVGRPRPVGLAAAPRRPARGGRRCRDRRDRSAPGRPNVARGTRSPRQPRRPVAVRRHDARPTYSHPAAPPVVARTHPRSPVAAPARSWRRRPGASPRLAQPAAPAGGPTGAHGGARRCHRCVPGGRPARHHTARGGQRAAQLRARPRGARTAVARSRPTRSHRQLPHRAGRVDDASPRRSGRAAVPVRTHRPCRGHSRARQPAQRTGSRRQPRRGRPRRAGHGVRRCRRLDRQRGARRTRPDVDQQPGDVPAARDGGHHHLTAHAHPARRQRYGALSVLLVRATLRGPDPSAVLGTAIRSTVAVVLLCAAVVIWVRKRDAFRRWWRGFVAEGRTQTNQQRSRS